MENSKSMKPKIRFKGVEKEWELYKLGNIASFSKGIGYSKSDLEDKGNPIILYGRLYTKYSSVIYNVDTFAILKSGSVLSKGEEVIIPSSGETPEDISIASAIKQKDVIIGGDLNILVFDKLKFEPSFMAIAITNSKTHKELSAYSQGKTVVHLHNKDIARGYITCPSLKEQLKIVLYAESIDSLISISSSRLASLKQIKAASLQSMFPQEGETTPRIRFKGFEEEWKIVLLEECLEINTEKNINDIFGINDVLSVSDEVGVVNQIKLLGRSYAGKSVSGYNILKTNQIVYTKSPLKSKPYGIIKVNRGEVGIVSVLYAVYDTKVGVSSDYIHYYFDPCFRINNYLLPLVNKGAKNTMNISDEMALQGCLTIPSFEEQMKIAAYFRSLDRQITLQTRRLEKLKQIKAACLDKMFV